MNTTKPVQKNVLILGDPVAHMKKQTGLTVSCQSAILSWKFSQVIQNRSLFTDYRTILHIYETKVKNMPPSKVKENDNR